MYQSPPPRDTATPGPWAVGKLHTGRSRNDQVATDTRMWLRGQLVLLRGYLRQLIAVAVERAELEVDVVMPGRDTLTLAQPEQFLWDELGGFIDNTVVTTSAQLRCGGLVGKVRPCHRGSRTCSQRRPCGGATGCCATPPAGSGTTCVWRI